MKKLIRVIDVKPGDKVELGLQSLVVEKVEKIIPSPLDAYRFDDYRGVEEYVRITYRYPVGISGAKDYPMNNSIYVGEGW